MEKRNRSNNSARATTARLRALVMLTLALGPVSFVSVDGARAQERPVEEAPSRPDRERPAAKFLRTENALPNRYIVVLEDEPSRAENALHAAESEDAARERDELTARIEAKAA